MTTSLIILAGGASSRMKKSSSVELNNSVLQQANSRSKALIILHDRPLLDYLLYHAQQAGFRRIYLVIAETDPLFKRYYGTQSSGNRYHGMVLSYAYQSIPKGRSKPLGTADALFQTLEQYPHLQQGQFAVCNCDNLYSIKAFQLLRSCVSTQALINYDREALVYPKSRIEQFALIKTNQKDFLTAIVEKPSPEVSEDFKDVEGKLRVSMNLFLFHGALLYPFLKNCHIDPVRNEKELPLAVIQMIKNHPNSVLGIPLSEHVPDVTTKSDILSMNAYLATHPIHSNWVKK